MKAETRQIVWILLAILGMAGLLALMVDQTELISNLPLKIPFRSKP